MTILPDKDEFTMIEVFNYMPELEKMLKTELPPKKVEYHPFTDFMYRQFTTEVTHQLMTHN